MPEGRRVILRKATVHDSKLLLAWRNDLETRRHSKSMRKVTELEHDAWLRKTLKDPSTRLFIILFDGQAAGSVRADYVTESWLLSWTVSPALRGRNIGCRAVAKLIEGLHCIIRAEVKTENFASIQIVKKLGMQCEEVKEEMTAWVLYR